MKYRLTKAVQQAQKSDPDKPTLVMHLKEAKELVEHVAGNVRAATLSGLRPALSKDDGGGASDHDSTTFSAL